MSTLDSAHAALAGATSGIEPRSVKVTKLIDILKSGVALGEQEIPGINIVILVDGKPVAGDLDAEIDALYRFICVDFTEEELAIANDPNVFVKLAVNRFGDSDDVRKKAHARFMKGA